ncbi:dihydrofolate reductase [Hyphobacterium marinum]|uniref:Dihydrofolate reductase n=1 Tax=Hyphobacterium marinum TaxID=3116574 RepID=A0ABU7LZI2_9PROT|nr:dihydrofolate reductase [Hyphobacterium sp. Y6023]MEE2566961.1 dihydrofolate reductase [Hyphobacterium sp. Y6023]
MSATGRVKDIHIALVAARGKNGVIGREGDLPWRLKSDLAWFKQITFGKPVIMGRKTWDSLPNKPLPGRANIVVTRQQGFVADGALVCHSLEDAIQTARQRAKETGIDEVSVIGGAQIYAEALPLADRLYLTEVDAAPDGEAVFPDIDEAAWTEKHREARAAGEADDHDFVLRVLERTA